MKLRLKPYCTCGSRLDKIHKLHCDLNYDKYESKLKVKKTKRFFFFYPLKVKK